MLEKFVKYLNDYIQFDKAELTYLKDFAETRIYKKNELIFEVGAISHEIYFVIDGCVRLFYLADGQDRTAFFFTEGQFICAGESYTFRVPARENYQAIEDSQIVLFKRSVIDTLLEKSPKFELLARIATENELIICQRMIESFVTKSAEERYIELLETNGELFHRVPQQYIASFLGVSPETLSRIKKRVLGK